MLPRTWNLTFGSTALDWAARLKHAHVVPRGENGGFAGTKDACWMKKVWWATHDKSWSAKPGDSAVWRDWQEQFGRWSKWGGCVGGGLTFVGSVFHQWSRDSDRTDLDTEPRSCGRSTGASSQRAPGRF